MKKNKFILASSTFLIAQYSIAQTETSKIVLQPITVKESKILDEVDSSKIEKKQDKNLGQLFKDSPDIQVGGNQNSNQKIYLRGLEENNLNITLDGARQNQNIFHHQGSLNIDVELLKKVEVSSGGVDVTAPGALGGSIRFVTKDADDFLASGSGLSGFLKSSWATNNSEFKKSFGFAYKPESLNKQLGFLFFGNHAQYTDYKAGGGYKVIHTSGAPYGLLFKTTWDSLVGDKLQLGIQERQDNANRLSRGNFGEAGGTTTTDQKLKLRNYSLSYNKNLLSLNARLLTEIHRSENELTYLSNSSNSIGRWTQQSVKVQFAKNFEDGDWKLGADLNNDKSEAVAATPKQSENGQIQGVYWQGFYNFSPQLQLASGFRWDQYRLQQPDNSVALQTRLSPQVSVSSDWNDNWRTELSWGEAFKGSVPGEAFLLGSVRSVTNNSLKGTISETTQAVLEFKQNTVKASATVYDTILENPIYMRLNRSTGNLSRTTGGPVRTQGTVLRIDQSYADYFLKASWGRNKIRNGAAPVGYTAFGVGAASGDKWTLGLSRAWESLDLDAGWDFVWVERLTDVPSGVATQPGYDLHDIYAGWAVKPDLNFKVSVHNLFDKKYVSQSTVYIVNGVETALYEPGRDIRLSLSYLFN